jgi:pentapeptide MXKDX repeat protein
MNHWTTKLLSTSLLISSAGAFAADEMKMDNAGMANPTMVKECMKQGATGNEKMDKACMKKHGMTKEAMRKGEMKK